MNADGLRNSAVAVARLLGSLASDVTAAAARCRDSDAEAIHDLRVAARRLETALRLWSTLLEPRARKRALRTLRRWRRRVAAARDLEVLVAMLADPGIAATPQDRAHVEAVRERLLERRDRARRRAADRLAPARLARLERRLQAAVPGDNAKDGPEAALLAAVGRFTRFEDAARTALVGAWELDEDVLLHEARVAIKKRRYAEEALAPVAGLPLSDGAVSARALQRALGAVHDRAQLRDCLHLHADRALSRRHPEQAAALTAAAERAEQHRREALAQFRSLRGPAPEVPAAD